MNHICHWELQTRDPATAKAFYESVLGWKLTFEKEMNYVLIETGGQPPNGGMNIVKEVEPSGALLYIQVEDIEARLKKAQELGGSIITAKTPIPRVGFFAIFQDAEGNRLGLFTPEEK